MKWKIAYYSEKVEKQILKLPKKLLARYFRMTDIMLKHGPNIGFPHTRSMGEGLFELRLKAQEGIARAFYCTMFKGEIVILHSIIKKTQQTPLKDLKTARKRMLEVINHENT